MQKTKTATEFRRDINGLRAWAVTAVILYHFEVWGAQAGFIGVDVFFVISGFLMTGLIVDKLEVGRFSIVDFYLARARRIIPALAVLVAFLLSTGFFFIQASDYKALATQAAYSMMFLSNFEFWQQAGYFDSASTEKWLLHTWSLSVEWQFYIVLPLVLATLWRLFPFRGVMLGALVAGAAVSFGLCVNTTSTASSAAFFLLPYRAWEMLLGGLAFMLAARLRMGSSARRVLHYTGAFLLLLASLLFDHNWAWPGLNAALPVLATAMVILSAHAAGWLDNPIAQWLGDRSYSLYLWHWPVYVSLVFSELRFVPLAIVAGLIVTLLLGHLSFVMVEKRSKIWLGSERRVLVGTAIAALMLVVVAPAVLVWKVQGLPGRFPEYVDLIARESANRNPRQSVCLVNNGVQPGRCIYGSGQRKVIVLGDSHADALVTGIAKALDTIGMRVEEMSYSACPFVQGMRVSYPSRAEKDGGYRCIEYVERLSRELKLAGAAEPIIIINRYGPAAFGYNEDPRSGTKPNVLFNKDHAQPNDDYLAEFSDAIVTTACRLAEQRTVYLMRPIPEIGTDVPKTLARRVSFGMNGDISISLAEYRQRNAWVWKAQDKARDQCGVRILDPLPYLCGQDRCYGSKKGRPLYFDDDHLSEYGNKLLVPMYLQAFRDGGKTF